MYNAPSVSYPVGRCAFQRWVYVVFAGATVVLMAVWGLLQPLSLAWLLAMLCASYAIVQGARSCLRDEGVLTWDGQSWYLQGHTDQAPIALGTVAVSLDVQHTLLLLWQPLSGESAYAKRWFWVGAEKAPKFWQDLRCAVFARTSDV